MKYIAITGGLLSGVGKGLTASSIARILKNRSINVTFIKIDPYLNCDASNLTPVDHGEVFVLSDGGEVDLDFGNYERFMHINLRKDNNITTGKVFKNIIELERKGHFNGKTVQITPHVTDYVVEWIETVAMRRVLNGKECNSSNVQPATKLSFNDKEKQKRIYEENKKMGDSMEEALYSSASVEENKNMGDIKKEELFYSASVEENKNMVDIKKEVLSFANSHEDVNNNLEEIKKEMPSFANSHEDVNNNIMDYSKIDLPFSADISNSSLKKELLVSDSAVNADHRANLKIDFKHLNNIEPLHKRYKQGESAEISSFLESSSEDLSELLENGLCGHNCNNTLETPDVCIIELGGTIGDIESSLFVESLRQLRNKVGPSNFIVISVEYVPVLPNGEQKTKPVQNSLIKARGLGIHPDVVVIRCSELLEPSSLQKIANFGEIKLQNIFQSPNVDSIYEIPGVLHSQGIGDKICEMLGFINTPNTRSFVSSQIYQLSSSADVLTNSLKTRNLDRKQLGQVESNISSDSIEKNMIEVQKAVIGTKKSSDALLSSVFEFIFQKYPQKVTIAIVGKYITNADTYISLLNALLLSSAKQQHILEIKWIDAENIEKGETEAQENLRACAGIVIAGGFGIRGTEGKIKAVQIAREEKVPIIGICLGFQLQVIEYARNVLNLSGATSEEFISEVCSNQNAPSAKKGNHGLANRPSSSHPSIPSDYFNTDKVIQNIKGVHLSFSPNMKSNSFLTPKEGSETVDKKGLIASQNVHSACDTIKTAPFNNVNISHTEDNLNESTKTPLLLIKKINSDRMSVGTKQMLLKNNTLIQKIYNKDRVNERYRHKYEFNDQFKAYFEESEMIFSGTQIENREVALELKNHPFFVGVQFHPEFLARPEHTHPLFDAFIQCCIKKITE